MEKDPGEYGCGGLLVTNEEEVQELRRVSRRKLISKIRKEKVPLLRDSIAQADRRDDGRPCPHFPPIE